MANWQWWLPGWSYTTLPDVSCQVPDKPTKPSLTPRLYPKKNLLQGPVKPNKPASPTLTQRQLVFIPNSPIRPPTPPGPPARSRRESTRKRAHGGSAEAPPTARPHHDVQSEPGRALGGRDATSQKEKLFSSLPKPNRNENPPPPPHPHEPRANSFPGPLMASPSLLNPPLNYYPPPARPRASEIDSSNSFPVVFNRGGFGLIDYYARRTEGLLYKRVRPRRAHTRRLPAALASRARAQAGEREREKGEPPRRGE